MDISSQNKLHKVIVIISEAEAEEHFPVEKLDRKAYCSNTS